jgi:hypothetical protein
MNPREQAAASPLAAGEATPRMLDALRESLWSTWGKDRQTTDWPSREELLTALNAALSSQAPKPASAGRWRSVLCPALLYPTLRKWLDEDSAKKAAEQVACALYDAFTAAEADK